MNDSLYIDLRDVYKDPVYQHGDVSITEVDVTQGEAFFDGLRNARDGKAWLNVQPGTYRRLHIKRELVMSDTPMERNTNRPFLLAAHGDVLIAGLGLGLIVIPLLTGKSRNVVDRITIIEQNADVIALVEPVMRSFLPVDQQWLLTVIHADINEWRPGKHQKWHTIYFDIWPTISTDNLPEINKLHRAFRKHLLPGGWMASWIQDELRAMRRKERREERNNAFYTLGGW